MDALAPTTENEGRKTMSRDKQIEEMAKHCPCYFGEKCCIDGELPEKCDMLCQFGTYAEILYNAGYRKSTDVAEEIFAEIEEAVGDIIDRFPFAKIKCLELKKKYIGKDTNVTTKETEGER